MKPVRIGVSGWAYKEWRGAFYAEGLPQRSWLEHYATRFDTVEVNSTFYRLPTESAVQGWVDATPPGFLFAIKGSRYSTHVKRLLDFGKYSERLFERLDPIITAGKLGPVLWQLPGSLRRDDWRLDEALTVLAERPGRHCFEFRHRSWFSGTVYERLAQAGAALVIADHPERDFQTRELTADWTYLRFERGSEMRRPGNAGSRLRPLASASKGGGYSAGDLATWRRRIAAWRARADVYAYFNHDRAPAAPDAAVDLAATFG